MALKLCNVRGDGNCYYRCVWNVLKNESDTVRFAVGLTNDVNGEDKAVKAIRKFVSEKLKTSEQAQTTLRNMWELAEVVDLSEEFPLAKRIKHFKNWDTVLRNSCDLIATTAIMASQLEHSIVKTTLEEVGMGLIVLSRTEEDLTLADLAEKWIYQLDIILPKIHTPRVTMFVNEDYIHYKFIKFNGNTITTHRDLTEFISSCMESDESDADE